MTSAANQLAGLAIEPPGATLTLSDPDRRNALSIAMFDGLDQRIDELAGRDDIITLILRGEGPAFCAGFDLPAAVEAPALMGVFIHRLSALMRRIRRLPIITIAAVHGAAIAGGCALLSACDFIVVEPEARLGYPVHAIGISPAVTLPTLRQRLGDGAARELVMSGRIIDGSEALRMGLATHLAEPGQTAHERAGSLAQRLAKSGRQALRTTKAWLNELDGSLDDAAFDGPARHSAAVAEDPVAISLLRAYWSARQSGRV